jgi:copper chaperone CopZ
MVTTTYTVNGMSCGHCVNSISTAITGLPEVAEANVDLATGTVSVVSTRPLEADMVREAVEDAGYALVR